MVETSNNPDGAPPFIGPSLVRQGRAMLVAATKHKDHVQFAFGAQLVEVRVHEDTGEIQVPRIVGAYAAGRVMNPRTARSQLMGAQIWGISAALHEATEIDRRSARYTNADLSEYLLPVNADIGEVTTHLRRGRGPLVNPLGIKGLGELGNVGVNAAVANAIFHATGHPSAQLADPQRAPAGRGVSEAHREREGRPALARPAHHPARRAARAPRAHRYQEGLRPRAMRRLHRAGRRRSE